MATDVTIGLILLFGCIGVLVLTYVCIFRMNFTRGFDLDCNTNIGRGSFGSTTMSQDDIEKLPCFDFKAREIEKGSCGDPADCAVCLEKFKAGEKCRLLPLCKHSFHAQCVDLWLLKAPVCPICRTGADSWKGGSGIEFRENQTGDSGQIADSDHFFGLESDNLSESAVGTRET